eukprot:1510994-Heterocapsa_arctica.AAC.1
MGCGYNDNPARLSGASRARCLRWWCPFWVFVAMIKSRSRGRIQMDGNGAYPRSDGCSSAASNRPNKGVRNWKAKFKCPDHL